MARRSSSVPAPGTSQGRHARRNRLLALGAAAVASLGVGIPLAVSSSASASASSNHPSAATLAKLPPAARRALRPTASVSGTKYFDGLGLKPGTIKHVFLIILENKSYDASFTGLNNNTYLYKTLTSQGALLKNYYGTGHFSQDNYLSMTSGQAPVTDTQSDCPYYNNMTGSVDTSGSLTSNPNYGQFTSSAGPNAAAGQNGCVYPASVPTLFNQLQSAGVSWKGYAQDLDNPDATGSPHSAGVQYCGAPYATPGVAGTTTQPNPGSANATDQYVPKHFPFPWFQSLLSTGLCNSTHIANLFDPSNGLYHDLQSESTTPALSYIVPNNCSDGHDAVCHGNNLSGGFADANTPNPTFNYTGGLYAADLFLEHVIPEIEASPAYKDGGLIDVTFDEAFPPFTYTGNSFRNSTDQAPNYSSSLISDSAGETLDGQAVGYEPTGPNTPLATDANGNQLYPGPGYNSYIDRPSNCISQTVPSAPASQCLLGGAGTPATSFPARTDALAHATMGSDIVHDNPATATATTPSDNGIQADDQGRAVSGTGIPAGSFVGPVTAYPKDATAANGTASGNANEAYDATFQLVDTNGNPVETTAPVSGISLAADTAQNDPLFTATGATTGGGDTGSVLISPYIKPGTSDYTYYNHYSWLRSMEDIFGVASSSPGLDGMGHIGYAAQPGLAPFGPDVFNAPYGLGGYKGSASERTDVRSRASRRSAAHGA